MYLSPAESPVLRLVSELKVCVGIRWHYMSPFDAVVFSFWFNDRILKLDKIRDPNLIIICSYANRCRRENIKAGYIWKNLLNIRISDQDRLYTPRVAPCRVSVATYQVLRFWLRHPGWNMVSSYSNFDFVVLDKTGWHYIKPLTFMFEMFCNITYDSRCHDTSDLFPWNYLNKKPNHPRHSYIFMRQQVFIIII